MQILQPRFSSAFLLLLLGGCAAPEDGDSADPAAPALSADAVGADDTGDAEDTGDVHRRRGGLDTRASTWSLVALGASVPLSNGSGVSSDGSVGYLDGTVFKRRSVSGTTETIASPAAGVSLIPGGSSLGAVWFVADQPRIGWRGTTGTWSSTSISYTTSGGPPVPTGCVDSTGNGHVVFVDNTDADLEGTLVAIPITNYRAGSPLTYSSDNEATAPSVICAESGSDEVVWRHQVGALDAEIWHATLTAGRLTAVSPVIDGGYDPHYAPGEWVGYHDAAANTVLARSTDGGASFTDTKDLAEASHFAEVATSGTVVASIYATWPTVAEAIDSTANQATRSAHLVVSLDDGTTWSTRDPWGSSMGYGPCNLAVTSTTIYGACRSPEGIAGFSYGYR